ncbi:MAG: glycosyltransferase family 2 protein [Patescibacteria group bacterium]
MKFSIIITIRAINNFLLESITNLKKLNYQNFEVLITTDSKEQYEFNDSRFSLICPGKTAPGEKRNFSACMASGDVLVFLDDDAYPTPNWLNEAATIFSDPQVYALGGPAITPPDAKLLEKCSGKILESWLTSAGTKYRHVPLRGKQIVDYPSVNLFVRKEAFEKVGGFLADFWPGEDTKLCLDLVKTYGRPFLYSPKPVVYHHRRNVFIPHLKQISRYGRHRGQFARIFPETSRLPSYFAPSAFVLGLFLGPFICVVIPLLWYFYGVCVTAYLALLTLEIFKVFMVERHLKLALYTGLGIFLTHVVYGLNFIHGLLIKPKLQLRGVDAKSGNYIGG